MNGAPVAFWDALCPEHGGLSHAVLHEAGHAVMAVHLGITFADVSISRDPRDNKSDVGRLTGGGVRMASPEDVEELVKRDLVGSFQFLVAGALAEYGAFRHCLDGSYRTDLNLWRNYAGLLEGQTDETLSTALGRPWKDELRDAGDLLESLSPAVTAVARGLGNHDYVPLTYAEVCELVEQPR